MGDPKKHRKKYTTPTHPWSKSRIEEEAVLTKEYGFKNKKEIWIADSLLRRFARKAKSLIPAEGKQTEIETKHLLDRLSGLGLLEPNSQLDKVLDVNLNSLLERRLQSILCRKGFAKTMKQARQFITHKHVLVGDSVITSPSYLVSVKDEALIRFAENSTLSNPEHPERVSSVKEEIKEEKKVISGKASGKTNKRVKSVTDKPATEVVIEKSKGVEA